MHRYIRLIVYDSHTKNNLVTGCKSDGTCLISLEIFHELSSINYFFKHNILVYYSSLKIIYICVCILINDIDFMSCL